MEQINLSENKIGNIRDIKLPKENLRLDCIPDNIYIMNATHPDNFYSNEENLWLK